MALGDGFSITQELFDAITTVVPSGGHLLEFGSGVGSTHLAEAGLWVTSLEHDPAWIDAARVEGHPRRRTFYAPMVSDQDCWDPCYQPEAVKRALSHTPFDAVLIDGPPGDIGRGGILNRPEELGVLNCPIFLDDLNRPADLEVAVELGQLLRRPLLINAPILHAISKEDVQFGIIPCKARYVEFT